MMTPSASSLLYLVRIGIHPDADLMPTPADVDWVTVVELASAQKVAAIALDGYSKLFEARMVTVDMDKPLKKQWIGQVIQSYEWKYPTYRATISRLASVYARPRDPDDGAEGVWLEPELSRTHASPLRGCGLLEFREYERGDQVLEEELGIRVDQSHHHHTTFHFEGQYFENHYDFVNVHSHPSSKRV